jgi:hypothetical protein
MRTLPGAASRVRTMRWGTFLWSASGPSRAAQVPRYGPVSTDSYSRCPRRRLRRRRGFDRPTRVRPPGRGIFHRVQPSSTRRLGGRARFCVQSLHCGGLRTTGCGRRHCQRTDRARSPCVYPRRRTQPANTIGCRLWSEPRWPRCSATKPAYVSRWLATASSGRVFTLSTCWPFVNISSCKSASGTRHGNMSGRRVRVDRRGHSRPSSGESSTRSCTGS